MAVRYTTNEMKEEFKKRGLELLSEHTSVKNKVAARCHCGSLFEVTPDSVLSGNTKSCGCLFKAFVNSPRIDMKEVDAALEKKGFKRLGEYRGTKCKTLILCHCGNTFEARLDNLIHGNIKGCGCLNGKSKRLGPEIISKRLKELGIELIGSCERINENTLMRCRCGNTFTAKPGNVLSGNTKSCGCHNDVAARARLTEPDNVNERLLKAGMEALSEYRGLKKINVCQMSLW